MKTPAELLKEEFIERYGLAPDQVKVEVTITGVSEDLASQITNDYARNKYSRIDGDKCKAAYGDSVNLWCHIKKEEEEHVES